MTKEEFITYLNSFNKDSGEFTEDELYEIGCKFKNELPLSEKDWSWLVEKLGPVNVKGEPKSGETFRIWIKSRQYQKGDIKRNEQLLSGQTINDISFPEFEDKTEEIKQGLYKQQTKTRDYMNAYRAMLREEARVELMKDLIKESVKTLPEIDFEKDVCYDAKADVEAVLLLSDLHIGCLVDNFFNKFNVEIARRRVHEVVRQTIEYCTKLGVSRLNVLNLGDLIENDLHITARLGQEIDAVEQTMTAAEIIAEAMLELSEAIPEVVYRSCLDNHSRYIMDYKAAKDEESLVKLIDWYLEEKLSKTDIKFAEDNLDRHIGLFELMNGDKFVFAHGHEIAVNQSCQSYMAATYSYIRYIALGHWHSTKMKTFQNSKVFVNGSIKGADDYSEKHGLFGEPEQTLLVFEGESLINITINLKNIK